MTRAEELEGAATVAPLLPPSFTGWPPSRALPALPPSPWSSHPAHHLTLALQLLSNTHPPTRPSLALQTGSPARQVLVHGYWRHSRHTLLLP